MRLVILTAGALLLSASCALAQGTSNTMTSGRPSAVLDDAQCYVEDGIAEWSNHITGSGRTVHR